MEEATRRAARVLFHHERDIFYQVLSQLYSERHRAQKTINWHPVDDYGESPIIQLPRVGCRSAGDPPTVLARKYGSSACHPSLSALGALWRRGGKCVKTRWVLTEKGEDLLV